MGDTILELVLDIIFEIATSNNRSKRTIRSRKPIRSRKATFFDNPDRPVKSNPYSWEESYQKNETSTSVTRNSESVSVEENTVEKEVSLEKNTKALSTPKVETVTVQEEIKEDNVVEAKTIEKEIVETNNTIEEDYSTFNVNRVTLEMLILVYVYTKDDGKVSFSEKAKIRDHFASYRFDLEAEELEEIKELIAMEPSLNNIRSHINQNNMKDKEVSYVLDCVEDLCGLNVDYRRIIKSIKESISNTINN